MLRLPRPADRTVLAALLPAVLALPACRGGSDGMGERRAFVDSRDTYDPRSLDPALSTDVPTGRAVSYLFDGLVRFTPDARVVPALATRWEVSPDGRPTPSTCARASPSTTAAVRRAPRVGSFRACARSGEQGWARLAAPAHRRRRGVRRRQGDDDRPASSW
jgi:hypothetical protein